MASEVQICNEALSFLGINSIISRTDNSKAARTCNLIFDDKRDELLRSFEWKFATVRTNLAPTSNTPAFKWTYEFNPPSDSLKILYVGDAYGTGYPYSLENKKILADYTLIYIKYTKKITDPNVMDVTFRSAFCKYLAQHLCVPLGKKDDYQKCVEEYETQLANARFAGSIETDGTDIIANDDDWLNSRI